MGDLYTLETADGLKWTMPNAERYITAYGGFGAVTSTFISLPRYRTAGALVRGIVQEKRELTLHFHQALVTNREVYWQKRADLQDLLRTNRGGPLLLTLTREDGSKRAIHIWPEPGAVLPPVDTSANIWVIDEEITFLALDPFWFNPDQVILTGVQTTDDGFIFPITFPITFGIGGTQFPFALTYPGSMLTYPVFTLTGPYVKVTFSNDVTGVSFSLDEPIESGETRVIDLNPTALSILDGNGDSKLTDLEDGFDLVDFHIEADPVAPGGVQTVNVIIHGVTAETAAQLSYYERFLGV